jgi:3-phenylpropionate/cinnamic acid dioxygenase small subunit
MERAAHDSYKVAANFVVYEYQNQSTMQLNVWPGRVEYSLRRVENELKMFRKKVHLVHASGSVPTMSFII